MQNDLFLQALRLRRHVESTPQREKHLDLNPRQPSIVCKVLERKRLHALNGKTEIRQDLIFCVTAMLKKTVHSISVFYMRNHHLGSTPQREKHLDVNPIGPSIVYNG